MAASPPPRPVVRPVDGGRWHPDGRIVVLLAGKGHAAEARGASSRRRRPTGLAIQFSWSVSGATGGGRTQMGRRWLLSLMEPDG
jgi:hypothetical protein